MSAFRQVVAKLQEGQREEALIGLEFVLRLDPAFAPAVNLQRQLASGAAEIDLSEVVSQLKAPTTDLINEMLVEAVDDFNQRNFLDAREKVEKVLLELPGHQEARQLLAQIQEALKVETQVGQFLTQAREALDRGDPQEAANFVMMAQALDPHHRGISATLQEIQVVSGARPETLPPPAAAAPLTDDEFAVSFAPLEPEAPPQPQPARELPTAAPADGLGFSFGSSPQPPVFDDLSAPTPQLFEQPETPAPPPAAGQGQPWSAESLGDFSFGPDETAPPAAPPEGAREEGFHEFAFGDGELEASPGPSPATDGDLSDLFSADSSSWAPSEPEPQPTAARPEDAERVRQLLAQGTAAFDRGDYRDAIDIWSRIHLVDPGHDEASRRIDEAHRRCEEVERKVEHLFYEAQDAALAGDVDRALELVDQVLSLSPAHIEAVELKEKLRASAGPAAAPGPAPATAAGPPPAALPDLDEDLFDDVSATVPAAAPAALPAAEPRRRQLPWLPIALSVAGLVVILLGAYFGSKILSPGSDGDAATVNRVLAQGETLFAQGRVEEAVHLYQELLQNLPPSDLDRQRIERRLDEYQRALTPPTPTPVPESLGIAEELLAQGRLLSAYSRVQLGLQGQPQSAQLLSLRDAILQQQPLVAPLYAAAQKGDFRAAVGIAEDLLDRSPNDAEVTSELTRYLFNAAVLELRAYNLTSAEGYLIRLIQLRPDDDEAVRVLRFTEKYKTRPVDLQLNTFIKSLSPR